MGIPRRYTTGPVEQDPSTNQLRIKLSNEDPNDEHAATVTVFNLNGEKKIVFQDTLSLPSRSSDFIIIDIPMLFQFEVEIAVADPDVYVGVFGFDTVNDRIVAANAIPFGDMVRVFTPV